MLDHILHYNYSSIMILDPHALISKAMSSLSANSFKYNVILPFYSWSVSPPHTNGRCLLYKSPNHRNILLPSFLMVNATPNEFIIVVFNIMSNNELTYANHNIIIYVTSIFISYSFLTSQHSDTYIKVDLIQPLKFSF